MLRMNIVRKLLSARARVKGLKTKCDEKVLINRHFAARQMPAKARPKSVHLLCAIAMARCQRIPGKFNC